MQEIPFIPYHGRRGVLLILLMAGLLASNICILALVPFSVLNIFAIIGNVLLVLTFLTSLSGFLVVYPNEAVVLLLFGNYKGTIKNSGFFYINPFYQKLKLSLRIRTSLTTTSSGKPLKVNDLEGNPVEIAAVIVWRVDDTTKALFDVDNYESYVQVQSESALRVMAAQYPYDSEKPSVISLRAHQQEVCAYLVEDLQRRVSLAGIKIFETRISHLAYAPEIAAAMLQRQQAQAIISARSKIVYGAVGMVEMAMEQLNTRQLVDLSPDKKIDLVSKLLIILCGGKEAQPVLDVMNS